MQLERLQASTMRLSEQVAARELAAATAAEAARGREEALLRRCEGLVADLRASSQAMQEKEMSVLAARAAVAEATQARLAAEQRVEAMQVEMAERVKALQSDHVVVSGARDAEMAKALQESERIREELNGEFIRCTEELAKMKRQLETSQMSLRTFEQQLSEEKAKSQTLQTEYSRQLESFHELRQENEKSRVQHESLLREHAVALSQHQVLTQQVQSQQQKIDEQRTLLIAAHDTINELDSAWQRDKTETAAVTTEITSLRTQLDALRAAHAEAQQRETVWAERERLTLEKLAAVAADEAERVKRGATGADFAWHR